MPASQTWRWTETETPPMRAEAEEESVDDEQADQHRRLDELAEQDRRPAQGEPGRHERDRDGDREHHEPAMRLPYPELAGPREQRREQACEQPSRRHRFQSSGGQTVRVHPSAGASFPAAQPSVEAAAGIT
jgi:hypothetical protein